MQEVLAKSGVEPGRARTILQLLLEDKRWSASAMNWCFIPSACSLCARMLAQKKGQRFAVPEFKEWTGISRKYAIPLLEFLDRERITRREGDARVVL